MNPDGGIPAAREKGKVRIYMQYLDSRFRGNDGINYRDFAGMTANKVVTPAEAGVQAVHDIPAQRGFD